MCVNAVESTFKTLAVTDVWRLAHIVEMLDMYEVVILLIVLLTVVMRLSLYTTTLCMLKVSGCKRVSEIVCISPPTDMQNTDVFEKTNPRQHLPAGACMTRGVVSLHTALHALVTGVDLAARDAEVEFITAKVLPGGSQR